MTTLMTRRLGGALMALGLMLGAGDARAQSYEFLLTFGNRGSGNGQFDFPSGVATAPSGHIVVADDFNHRIQVFNSAGGHQLTFGGPGSGNGQFNFPSGVATAPSGHIVVADNFNNRIQVFDSAGGHHLTFGGPGSGDGQFNTPFGVAVDPTTGNIVVADRDNHRIQVFDSAGAHQFTLGGPGSGDGQFSLPAGVAVDPTTGNIVVADLDNHRIQVFAPVRDTLTLTAAKDSFLRKGNPDRNEGANPGLRLQAAGDNRVVVGFDEAAIEEFLAGNNLTSATLELTIAEIANNWGRNNDRTVDAHPLLTDFAEGTGQNAELPGAQSTRGSGPGVTWNCAEDAEIANQRTDCEPRWDGGGFGPANALPVLHFNGLSGPVSWDVTDDVRAGASAWLIKKTSERQAGQVTYHSREGADHPVLRPRLILEAGPPDK